MNDEKAVVFVSPLVGIVILVAMVATVSFAVVTFLSAIEVHVPFSRIAVICLGLMAFSAATSLLRPPASQDKDNP